LVPLLAANMIGSMPRLAWWAFATVAIAAIGCQNPGGATGGGGSGGSVGGAGPASGATTTATTGATTTSTSAATTSASSTSQSSTGTAMMCNTDGTTGPCCSVNGNIGVCIDTMTCPNDGDHVSVAGYCPGAANIECCVDAPDTMDNPPVPAGWVLMMQSEVTPAMTNWAVMILHDPMDYPMYSSAMQTFPTSGGSLLVMAVVQWHPPDFQNSAVHRGVTLYKQSGG
jgi:hypothetical protein